MPVRNLFFERIRVLPIPDSSYDLCPDTESRFLWYLLYLSVQSNVEPQWVRLEPKNNHTEHTVLLALEKKTRKEIGAVPFGSTNHLIVAANPTRWLGWVAKILRNGTLFMRPFQTANVHFNFLDLKFTNSDTHNPFRNAWLSNHSTDLEHIQTYTSLKKLQIDLINDLIARSNLEIDQFLFSHPVVEQSKLQPSYESAPTYS